MFIRCPNCGRRGYLPDHLAPEAHSLRCRKCLANFRTPELVQGRTDRRGVTAIDQPSNRVNSEEPAPYLGEGYFAGFGAGATTPHQRGPGDSHYELTFTLKDDRPDAVIDWHERPEDTPYRHRGDADEMASSGEIEAIGPIGDEPPASEPWRYGFVESWSVVLVRAVLVLVGVSVPLLGLLLWRASGAGDRWSVPTPLLIAAFACAISLMVISILLSLLVGLVGELAREIRRLRHHLDRESRMGRL